MRWKRLSVGAAVAVGLLFCLVYFNPSISYTDLKQVRTELQDAGFHCTGDRANGVAGNGFIVSRKPVAWEAANVMWKAGPMGKDWKDKAWIAKTSSLTPLETTPGDQAPRVWGRVMAFGDEQFLNEIEGALKRTRRFGWL